jgi:hypothetical protein
MILLRSVSVAVAVALSLAGNAQGAVLTPGTLYGLVFDNAASKETVVTVDGATAAFTPVAAGVADCCTIGGFPVLALDPDTGGFYAAGNLFSDPPASPFRLLGFDAAGGALVSSPFLPAGFNYNIVKLHLGTGTLYGLVFDLGTSQEKVVTIDPATATLTPVGSGVADCCTIGGFNVSALDPDSGIFYAAGNLLSDPLASPKRLLGFDVASGSLVSSPFLPGGFNYNDFELDPLTGTLYGLVFDFGTSQEKVVTIDPATAAITPVGAGVADCCTVSNFSTLDADNGVLYIRGNRLSDPPGSPPRLLGFDVASGALASTPFLPAGFNYNVLQAAVVLPSNQPPVAVCRDVTVAADPGLCTAAAAIDDGSYDPDGDPITLSQDPAGPYPVGDTLVTLTVEDDQGGSDSCQGTVTVEDQQAPVILCNSPATITPPQAPISFTATAQDNCGGATVQILSYDCWKFTRNGRRVDKTDSCVVTINGATITIVDSGGVSDHIGWTVHAADGGGNGVTTQCEVVVANPGHP